jgi:hypothetical protein
MDDFEGRWKVPRRLVPDAKFFSDAIPMLGIKEGVPPDGWVRVGVVSAGGYWAPAESARRAAAEYASGLFPEKKE